MLVYTHQEHSSCSLVTANKPLLTLYFRRKGDMRGAAHGPLHTTERLAVDY